MSPPGRPKGEYRSAQREGTPVSAPAADVEAVILAAGQGMRLGLGPKAFVELTGYSLLERAVTTMLSVAARVNVAVRAADVPRAERLVGGPTIRIIAGGARRIDTLRALVATATAPWLLVHDVVHPFVTSEFSRRVIDEARRRGAAAAALPNVDFLYGADGGHRAAPGDVVAIQKPIVFRRADMVQGFALAERAAAGALIPDASALEILALTGQPIAYVAGSAMNFKLTTRDDLELAQRLTRPG
jgi:2-C-methyl-D-erythritol 4-phosphate cytidylyltransferase